MSDRHVLRPDVGKGHAAGLADLLRWPMVEDVSPDRDRGVDGLTEWELPDGVNFFYCVDADFDVSYVALTGPDQRVVDPFLAQIKAALNPWRVDELIEQYDATDTGEVKAHLTLLIGIAAPNAFYEGAFERISRSMRNRNANIRWIGVRATTYTGYNEFIPTIRQLRDTESVDWVRARAESVLGVFEDFKESP